MKNNYTALVDCIQKTFGSTILYSKDCLLLSEDIFNKIQIRISAQTLRRLMNFINDGVNISNTSLNHLSVYCGYENYLDFTKLNNDNKKTVDSKEVKHIKLFYSIHVKTNGFDDNYHNASKNISKLLLANDSLLAKTSTFLSKNPASQVYFFERFPFIDRLSSGYNFHLKKYLYEKKSGEAQLFGNCLLYLGYALANNSKRHKQIALINEIEIDEKIHPFPLARKYACNLIEHYLNQNKTELNHWITISIKESNKINKTKKEYLNFPYFQFIIADTFNLIERPIEAAEILKICELDYKRIPDSTLDEGYIEALDLIKAINLFYLGKKSDCKRILNRLQAKDIIFIMHDYFQIQRLIVEINLFKNTHTGIKIQKKQNQLNALIKKTNFTFFNKSL